MQKNTYICIVIFDHVYDLLKWLAVELFDYLLLVLRTQDAEILQGRTLNTPLLSNALKACPAASQASILELMLP